MYRYRNPKNTKFQNISLNKNGVLDENVILKGSLT
jgi:hypothetical protein